ncbi:MAG: Vgb family protein [Opitutaceae bacterium]
MKIYKSLSIGCAVFGSALSLNAGDTCCPTKPLFVEAGKDVFPIEDSSRRNPLHSTKLFATLPDYCPTPDAFAVSPDGYLVLSCPNYADQSKPGVLIKLTEDGQATKLAEVPFPVGGNRTNPMGIAFGEDGALYIADSLGLGRGRILRMVFKEEQLISTAVVATGLDAPNGVRCRGGAVYVTQPKLKKFGTTNITSGVYRFDCSDRDVVVSNDSNDSNLIFTVETKNPMRQMGLDGIEFDSSGNLYVGNLGDGDVHKLELDTAGRVQSSSIYAKLPNDAAIDGICMDEQGNLYCAGFANNSLYKVNIQGEVQLLAQYDDNDGANGELDQPADLMVYNGRVVISNFDLMSAKGMVNSGHGKPYTLSYYELD